MDADTDAGGDNADNNSSAAQAQARDTERCREDLVGGLLKTHLLYRIRYLLKDSGLLDLQGSTQTRPGKDATAAVAPASAIVLDSNIRVLNVLVRVARHSLSSATAVAECPDLIATLFRRYIDLPRAPASAQEGGCVPSTCTLRGGDCVCCFGLCGHVGISMWVSLCGCVNAGVWVCLCGRGIITTQ